VPYQVGEMTNPKPDDQWLTTIDDAEREAGRLSVRDTNCPIAIWDENCDVLKLFLCGQIFEPT
jgi:hypothetical protein